MSNTAVVISTYHRTFEGDGNNTIKNYRDQNFEHFYVLFDDHHGYDEEMIAEKYGGGLTVCSYTMSDFQQNSFDRPISTFHRWGSHQNPNYFYAHHRMLLFYLRNPHYQYYWFFDDDVIFRGDLYGLLKPYEKENEDFFAIQVFKKEDYTELPRVSQVNERMGSGGNWLCFAPGPGDNYKTANRHLGSFFPIVRFSNQAMKHLLELNREGYFGYSEGFVPTSLASDGFKVASMLDEHDNYFVPSEANCELMHKGSKFTWSWI
jgi:hypothetical protein